MQKLSPVLIIVLLTSAAPAIEPGPTPVPIPRTRPNPKPKQGAPANSGKPASPTPSGTAEPGGTVTIDWTKPETYLPPPDGRSRVDDGAPVIDKRWDNYFLVLGTLTAAKRETDEECYEPVPWLYRIRDARRYAAEKGVPFVVYVSDEQRFPIAGEGSSAWEDYKKEHGGTAPAKTIFESASVQNAFSEAGVHLFVKVEHSEENRELIEKLRAGPESLLIVAPNGEQLAKLSGDECTPPNVRRYLTNDFSNQLTAWRERQKASGEPTAPASLSPQAAPEVSPQQPGSAEAAH